MQRIPILVVDDESSVREAVADLVRVAGGDPQSAASGAEAKALAERVRCWGAVIDKNLGDQSGTDLLRDLKQLNPDLEAILVTGAPDLDSVMAALRLGALDYVLKPIDPALLRVRLEQIIERARTIEEHALLQRKLVRADRLAALGALAASVAHEVNNPLAYLTSNVQFVRRRMLELAQLPAFAQLISGEDAEELRSALDDSAEGAERIRVIVQDLRAFARTDTDGAAPVDVARAVQTALTMAQGSLHGRTRVATNFAPCKPVHANEPRLVQVFVNLILNAGQAFADRAVSNEVQLTVRPRSDTHVQVTVADNGPGLLPEARQRLFEPFFITRPPGESTGLGLSISRSIVQNLGGTLEVESAPGQGCAFHVVLPFAGAPSAADDGSSGNLMRRA